MDDNWGYPYDSGNHHLGTIFLQLTQCPKDLGGRLRRFVGLRNGVGPQVFYRRALRMVIGRNSPEIQKQSKVLLRQ